MDFFVVMRHRSVGHQEGRSDPWNGTTRNGIEIGVQTGYSSQSRQRYLSKQRKETHTCRIRTQRETQPIEAGGRSTKNNNK